MADKLPEVPVLHIQQSQDAELYKAKIREDKVYLKNGKVAQFTNRGVFTVKNRLGRRKTRIKMLIYVEGKTACGEIRTNEEVVKRAIEETDSAALTNPVQLEQMKEKLQTLKENVYTIFEPLTDKDRITVVMREIAKQLGKIKSMETWQFFLLMGIQISCTVAIILFLR